MPAYACNQKKEDKRPDIPELLNKWCNVRYGHENV
jgi:hypothetical protein